ncbi:PepSY-associated TM helix domain-containing protein [Pinibacter soli]|uniref:PepSY-associated TM helix domain-containing protein n=1 Tax=Pinibacter soli TaxID=3044211 RepID=A0ABT6RCU4_9BACT|nr:PepSY-associated TM helix domain-containing protein [Pinibacter soli]MDI3320375.1 PepSY-associated TM helix domain-containing protein [Pinibacter soli]
MKNKLTFRRVIHLIHLWVGVPCALFLFFICISGTVYVFNKEITQWFDRDLTTIKATEGAVKLTPDQLKVLVENEKKGMIIAAIQIPQSNTEAWVFSIRPKEDKKNKPQAEMNEMQSAPPKADGKNGKDERGGPQRKNNERVQMKNFFVDPYTGKILGDAQTPSAKFFLFVMQFHRWLLIDNHDIGAAITGTAAILMILLQITGMMLWFPAKIKSWKKKHLWKQGFVVKRNASGKRFNFDLHKAIGFYTFLFITIMAITGPVMGFDWYKAGFSKALGVNPVKKGQENEMKSAVNTDSLPAISIATALAKSNETLAGDFTTKFFLPKDNEGVITVQKNKEGFFESPAADRLMIDQYTAQVIKVERFAEKTTGQKIVTLAKAIHTGEIFGTFSKILYFIACLLATSLPITGVIIWWGRRNKTSKTSVVVKEDDLVTV